MAKIIGRAQLTVAATFELSEAELGALDALAGYGTDSFLEVFYEHLGKHYLKPYEAGLRSLFETVRPAASSILSRKRDAARVWDGSHRAQPNWVDRLPAFEPDNGDTEGYPS